MAKRVPRIYSEQEAIALEQAATNNRDRLIVQLGHGAGLRVAELVNLDVPDVQLDRGMLFVNQGKGKKDRVIPIAGKLMEPLSAWIGNRRSGPLFRSSWKSKPRLSTRAVQKIIKKLARAAGLRDADKPRAFSPHKLRHFFASSLLEKGATIREVQDLMGHSSLSSTEHYLHTNPERLRGAVDRL